MACEHGLKAPLVCSDLILVEEICHRVCNQYAQAVGAIRQAAVSVRSREARAALASTADRLMAYAYAHRVLQAPDGLGEVSLPNHLEQLCAAMSASTLLERNIRLILVTEPVMLPARCCWRVALVTAELITNSLRHGLRQGPGEIIVKVACQGDRLVCEVTDDGTGCAGRPGRGSAIVLALSAELGGEVDWRFGPDGTTARLAFPLPRQELLA